MLNKVFIPFYVIAGLFVVMSFYMTTVYFYKPNDAELEDAAVEINLPVIQLDQYLNLSKSLE